ncbi:MAG TPA: PIG-L deacetylase family protein [Solirubrobacteraceae bacterium]|nr:PIG-L deacetylase family protein [Solirubrobacteraceae bacterium]
MTSVVAIVAHPDDESLIAGGALALAADAGAQTGVISLTRGEHGPISEARLATRANLAAVREAELRDAGEILGLGWSTCLRLPDGELPWCDHEAVAGELAGLLGRHGASAVLTFGDDGLYGHPDHIATRVMAGMAIAKVAARGDGRVALYEAAWDSDLMPALSAAAAARGLPADLWGLEPEAFGSPGAAPTLVLDVRGVVGRKLAAVRAHRTQVGDGHLLGTLPPDLAARFLGAEPWRLVLAGDRGDVLRDLLEGVR